MWLVLEVTVMMQTKSSEMPWSIRWHLGTILNKRDNELQDNKAKSLLGR